MLYIQYIIFRVYIVHITYYKYYTNPALRMCDICIKVIMIKTKYTNIVYIFAF